MAAEIPLSQAIEEYLSWLELDRHADGTVAEYRRDLERFADFAGGDAGVPAMSWIDRDLLRGHQRHWRCLAPSGRHRVRLVSTCPARTRSRRRRDQLVDTE
jgi:site-specific recombinase XerD